MQPQPSVRIGTCIFGASLQQLELDATPNAKKRAYNFIFGCIQHLLNQVNTAREWQIVVKYGREVAKIINEFNVDVILTSPNEVFNYLQIFLDQLPSELIPEFLFHSFLGDERNGISDLRLLPSLQLDLLTAIVELLRLVKQSDTTDSTKQLLRQSIESSLFKKWKSPEKSSHIMDNIIEHFGSDVSGTTESLDRNIADCSVNIKEISMKVKMTAVIFSQDNRRAREAKAHLTLCDVKLMTVVEQLPLTKYLIDNYHLVVFGKYLVDLRLLLMSKQGFGELDQVTRSSHLFIEVQRLLKAMSYHLDIFIHYVAKNTGADWSQNEELVQQLENLTVAHLTGTMKSFWRENIGVDKIVVQRDVFQEALCSFAKIDWSHAEIEELMHLLDKFSTGFVTLFAFADLMRSFGNNVKLIRQAINCPYFLGYIGKEGPRLLYLRPHGSYLLRFNKHLIIDYIAHGIKKHVIVAVYSGFSLDLPNAEIYLSLDDLVASLPELTIPFMRKTSLVNCPGYCGILPESEKKFLADLLQTYIVGFIADGEGVEITSGAAWSNSWLSSFFKFSGKGWRAPFSTVDYDSIEDILSKRFPVATPYKFDYRVRQTGTEQQVNARQVSEPTSMNFYLSRKKPIKIVTMRHLDITSVQQVDLLAAALANNESLTSVTIAPTSQSTPLLRALHRHPNIRQLKIADMVDKSFVNEALVHLMASLPRLNKVIFGFGSPDLILAAIKAPRLQVVQLDFINSEKVLDAIVALFTTNTSLTTLHIMKPLAQIYNDKVLRTIGQLPLKELRINSCAGRGGASFNNIERLILVDPQDSDLHTTSGMKNLKELIAFTEPSAIHDTAFSVAEKLYNVPQLKFCGMHHQVSCTIWNIRKSKALFLVSNSVVCCGKQHAGPDSLIEFSNFLEDRSDVEYLSLRGYDGNFMNQLNAVLKKLQRLKVLRLVDSRESSYEIESKSKFVEGLSQLKSLRAISIIGGRRVFSEQEIIESIPNLVRLEIGGASFGLHMYDLAKLLSNPACVIVDFQDSVHASCTERDRLTGRRFQHYTRALRQRVTDEILDFIVLMHNIVRSPEALCRFPVEIWEQIFSFQYSFRPFLEVRGVLSKIIANSPRVTKVVDWQEVLPPPEELYQFD